MTTTIDMKPVLERSAARIRRRASRRRWIDQGDPRNTLLLGTLLVVLVVANFWAFSRCKDPRVEYVLPESSHLAAGVSAF